MVWFYNSVFGQRGTLEIDINYMYRQPLWQITYKTPNIAGYSNWQAPVLDIHELGAGKLSALFDRKVSRDLFDAHHLLGLSQLEPEIIRVAFTTYLAMTKIDLNSLHPEKIEFDLVDLKNRLLPILHQHELPRTPSTLLAWAKKLLEETRERLELVIPLRAHEVDFINQIRNPGVIRPELITNSTELIERIKVQPALKWAAIRKEVIH